MWQRGGRGAVKCSSRLVYGLFSVELDFETRGGGGGGMVDGGVSP